MAEAPVKRKKKLLAFEKLFEDKDQEVLLQTTEAGTEEPSLVEKAKNELLIYQRFPAVLSSVHPLLWWS